MKNSTVELVLDQLRRDGRTEGGRDLKDGECQEILEPITQIDRAFING